jgi:hypothetical protein
MQVWRTAGYTERRTELLAYRVSVSTSIFSTAFHKMNMDHEKSIELVGEHGKLHDVSNSQSGDSLHTDRDWAEAAEGKKQTREFSTFCLYYLKIK